MADAQTIFTEAMGQVFGNWTVLNLAVDQGWGGRDSVGKRAEFFEEYMTLLINPPKPWKNFSDDRDKIADFLLNRISELYNCDIEDESDLAVAETSLRLLSECRQGDFTLARQIIETNVKRTEVAKQCRGVRTYEYDGIGGNADGASGDVHMGGENMAMNVEIDTDGEGSDESDEEIPPSRAPREHVPAPVDEDGFQTVVPRRRR